MECWGGPVYYRCTRCGKVYYSSDGITAAVKRESELGAYLTTIRAGEE